MLGYYRNERNLLSELNITWKNTFYLGRMLGIIGTSGLSSLPLTPGRGCGLLVALEPNCCNGSAPRQLATGGDCATDSGKRDLGLSWTALPSGRPVDGSAFDAARDQSHTSHRKAGLCPSIVLRWILQRPRRRFTPLRSRRISRSHFPSKPSVELCSIMFASFATQTPWWRFPALAPRHFCC